MDPIIGFIACILGKNPVLTVIKLTPSEQVQRSRLKQKLLKKDKSWTKIQIRLYLAELPELWVTKAGKSKAEHLKRLNQIIHEWAPKEVIYWENRLHQDEFKKKRLKQL